MKERFKLIPAVYLILRRDDQVLLLRRANTGYQDGKYSVIAGHLDGNELAVDGMLREAREEVGIVISKEDLRFVHVAHRLTRNEVGQERLDLFFECSAWKGEVKNMEPAKCDKLGWYPITNLPDDTLPFIRLVLADVEVGKRYAEYILEPK